MYIARLLKEKENEALGYSSEQLICTSQMNIESLKANYVNKQTAHF